MLRLPASPNKDKSLSTTAFELVTLINFYHEVVAQNHPNLDVEELINIRTHNREHLQKLIADLFPVLIYALIRRLWRIIVTGS
ncbi:hypothetical protein [Hydrogenovibrio marinus]|uniref:hypothetical protein n=1 Tax=Hydrogenovibrio marinus TaxID=28885 RepID=UPI0004A7670D|nr:hypothetical protein [Hydrogenovibrio marinus]